MAPSLKEFDDSRLTGSCDPLARSESARLGGRGLELHGLTALAAQFSFRIPPIEVPFTLQTGAVLLAGGVLGANRGLLSQALYVILGAFGLPVFAEANSGFDYLRGPTGGYLIGFVLAAFLVGKFAERRHDCQFVTGFGAFTLGSLIIYVFGVLGLMINIDLTFGQAVANGVVPFASGISAKPLLRDWSFPRHGKLSGGSSSHDIG